MSTISTHSFLGAALMVHHPRGFWTSTQDTTPFKDNLRRSGEILSTYLDGFHTREAGSVDCNVHAIQDEHLVLTTDGDGFITLLVFANPDMASLWMDEVDAEYTLWAGE